MKKVKACVNPNCSEYGKLIPFNSENTFCTSCGGKLIHVCKECKTILASNKKVYCELCTEKHSNIKNKIAIAAGAAMAVAAIGVKTIKK